jgi:hypothetical protein
MNQRPRLHVGSDMAFAVILIEQGAYGEEVGRKAVAINIPTREAAAAEAERLAKEHEAHGYNNEHGYWWYRDGILVRRLVID